MNFERFEVEEFVDMYGGLKNDPIGHDIPFRLNGMIRLCEDWLVQDTVISKQSAGLYLARKTVISGVFLLALTIGITDGKRRRKKKAMQHHKDLFLREYAASDAEQTVRLYNKKDAR